MGIDAFTEDWDKFTLAYIFPPPPMVELVLNRIYQCSKNSSFILITPWRVGALWFPKVLKLATQTPIRLPVSWNTVVDMAESEVSPTNSKGGKIKFVAWKISGIVSQKLENCPLGLSRLFSRAGRRTLKTAMNWGSGIRPNIAEGISWTILPRLQSI